MKSLRRLFLDGLLIVIPVALIAILAVYVIDFFKEIVRPVVDLLPVHSFLGVAALTICAILALLVLVLLAGLLVRWRARRVLEWLERKVLSRIPIYQMVMRISQDVVDPDGEDLAVLVDLEGVGIARLGIFVERVGDDRAVVFLPDAPSAVTGSVLIVSNDRLRKLDAKGLQVMDVLSNRGIGAAEVLRAKRDDAS